MTEKEYEKLNESEKKLYVTGCDNRTGKLTGKYKKKDVKNEKPNKPFSLNKKN